MFLRRDYSAPGPGIDPDQPEKTGIARFFEILQLECGDLLKLNVLFVLSCVPLITIPPALFAMNQVVRKMVRDEPVDCFYHYRRAFCRFWRQAYAAFLLTALPLGAAGWGGLFYLRGAQSNFLLLLPFVFCSTVFLVTLLSAPFLYALLAGGMEGRHALQLALTMGVGRPGRSVPAAIAGLGLVTFGVLAFPFSGLYLLLIGFSLPCLLSNFLIRTILKPYQEG